MDDNKLKGEVVYLQEIYKSIQLGHIDNLDMQESITKNNRELYDAYKFIHKSYFGLIKKINENEEMHKRQYDNQLKTFSVSQADLMKRLKEAEDKVEEMSKNLDSARGQNDMLTNITDKQWWKNPVAGPIASETITVRKLKK